MKKIGSWQLKKELLDKVSKWKSYLEGGETKKPNEIRNFNVECIKIPEKSLLASFFKHFGKDVPCLFDVIDSKGKYRIKRNKIAHDFEKFGKPETYFEYAKRLDDALHEMLNCFKI